MTLDVAAPICGMIAALIIAVMGAHALLHSPKQWRPIHPAEIRKGDRLRITFTLAPYRAYETTWPSSPLVIEDRVTLVYGQGIKFGARVIGWAEVNAATRIERFSR